MSSDSVMLQVSKILVSVLFVLLRPWMFLLYKKLSKEKQKRLRAKAKKYQMSKKYKDRAGKSRVLGTKFKIYLACYMFL